ncbi:MAG: helix-turn-helix domain-containing protein [Chloroflexota bacterium]|nr:helix-turn-helix domain-containing protein [Chloroflexota bacterium]
MSALPLTAREAAEVAGVSERTIRRAIAAANGLPLPFPQVPSTYTSAPTIPLRRLQPRTAVAP